MTPRSPLTRAQLDHLKCTMPGCKTAHEETSPLRLRGRCHPSAGNEVKYQDGVLEVRCQICKREVASVKVAES